MKEAGSADLGKELLWGLKEADSERKIRKSLLIFDCKMMIFWMQ